MSMARSVRKAGGIFGLSSGRQPAPLERSGIFSYKLPPDIMAEKLTTTIPGQWVRNQDLEPLGDAATAAADQAAQAAVEAARTAAAARIQTTQFPWVGAVLAVGAVIALGWLIKER